MPADLMLNDLSEQPSSYSLPSSNSQKEYSQASTKSTISSITDDVFDNGFIRSQERHWRQLLAKSFSLCDDLKKKGLPCRKKEFTISERVEIVQDYMDRGESKKSVGNICKKYNCTQSSFFLWKRDLPYLKDRSKTAICGGRMRDWTDGLERIREAIIDFIEINKGVLPCYSLTLTGGVIALRGAMARDLLLEKHEEEPCLSEKEYKKIKSFTASEG